jgi:hypothetical protein
MHPTSKSIAELHEWWKVVAFETMTREDQIRVLEDRKSVAIIRLDGLEKERIMHLKKIDEISLQIEELKRVS